MRAHTKGRNVLLVFEEDVGAALTKACELDSDNDVVHLVRAAPTVRRQMFEEGELFNGFPEGCQEYSVPSRLRALMSMVLEGPIIKDQMADTTPAVLANAQILKFNCINDNRAHPTTGLVTARHSAVQETPVPTYVGMMLHTHTRKRELVDMLSHLGMSISYTRVIELSAQMCNSACQQFHREQVVCSPKDAQHCSLFNVSHRQYRPQCQFNDSERVPWYSYLPPPAPYFTDEEVDQSIAIVGGYTADQRGQHWDRREHIVVSV